MDDREDPRAVSAARRARQQYGRHPVRWRTADAGDRPRADDQSAAVDPGRGHRGAGAADPRGNLALPVDAGRAGAIGSGDRQEHRASHPHRRPPLYHRTGTGGLERHIGAIDRQARSAASVFGGMSGSEALPIFVMAGLIPAIHIFLHNLYFKTWMPGTSPGMTSRKTANRILKTSRNIRAVPIQTRRPESARSRRS